MEENKNLEENIDSRNKPRKGFFWISLFLLVIFISSFFGAIFGFISGGVMQKLTPNLFRKLLSGEKNIEITKQNIVEEESALIDVVEKTSPAVVSIVISKDVSVTRNSLFEQFFYGISPNQNQQEDTKQKQTVGAGSGFLVSEDGMIVTNKHVVSDTTAEYTVITNDDQEHSAKVLARDPINDVAILKIDGSEYPTLTLGNSDNLKVGQTAIAIGYSLGEFSNTVSRGIISGLKRNLVAGSTLQGSEKLSDTIQTDAAINPGNSGGPLLNINGDVIGINVAIVQGAQNIGFAIPSNQIKKIVDQVKTFGKISIPYLGVRYIPINDEIQKANNLPFNYGVIIKSGQSISELAIIPGSPADKAGLIENDIILEIDGEKITENNPLANLIAKYNVGDEISLKIWRKGKEQTIEATLEEREQ